MATKAKKKKATESRAEQGEREVTVKSARPWKPAQDEGKAHMLRARVLAHRELPSRFGARHIVQVEALAATEDSNGVIVEGEVLDIWLSAALFVLNKVRPGTKVRVEPDGWGGPTETRREYRVWVS